MCLVFSSFGTRKVQKWLSGPLFAQRMAKGFGWLLLALICPVLSPPHNMKPHCPGWGRNRGGDFLDLVVMSAISIILVHICKKSSQSNQLWLRPLVPQAVCQILIFLFANDSSVITALPWPCWEARKEIWNLREVKWLFSSPPAGKCQISDVNQV